LEQGDKVVTSNPATLFPAGLLELGHNMIDEAKINFSDGIHDGRTPFLVQAAKA
jgi:hypothetical protein